MGLCLTGTPPLAQNPFIDVDLGLDHGVGHPPAASGPRQNTSAPEAKRVQGFRRDAERSQMAETGSEAYNLFPRFSQERSAAMVHAPGLLHIGGSAYFVWADPPGGACRPQGLSWCGRWYRVPSANGSEPLVMGPSLGDKSQHD